MLSQLRLYNNLVTDLKLRVRSVLALLVFLKWTLPNVFSTLQSKLGGDLTFSLLYHRGHLQIIIYLFKSICFPALTAFHSCSVDHLSQRTVPTTVACIAGFKVHWWKSQLLWLGRSCCLRSCSLLKARQMKTSEEDFLQQKKHKGTCRTTKPGKPMGQCHAVRGAAAWKLYCIESDVSSKTRSSNSFSCTAWYWMTLWIITQERRAGV